MVEAPAPARPWLAWLPWVSVYLVALAVRAWFLGEPVYGDEAAHFYVARHLGAMPGHIVPDFGATHWLFMQRPLFSLLLWPGAALSFTGYRVWHILLSSLLAPLAMALVRQARGRPWTAAAVGAAVALLPSLVGWAVRVFPDSLMAVLFLGGVLLHGRGRHGWAAGAFVAAAWTKEVAAAGILAVFLASLVQGVRRREVGLWPVRFDKACTAYGAAGLLAPLPVLISVFFLHGPPPGWSTSPATASLWEGVFASAWLIPLVALGLRWPRTRRLALWALVFPAFYGIYGFVLHRGVEAWYLVLPQTLAVAAAGVALEEAVQRAATPAGRRAGQAAAGVLLVLLVVVAAVPNGVGAKGLTAPLGDPAMSLPQMHADLVRPHELDAPLAALPLTKATDVMVVDVGWFYVFYPFAETANVTVWGFSEFESPMGYWIAGVEGHHQTLIEKNDHPLNRALRSTYADCQTWENAQFVILEGQRCAGREAALVAALKAAHA